MSPSHGRSDNRCGKHKRIDPDNAWFTHLAAAAEAKNCVKKNSRKGRRVDGNFIYDEAPSWQILDQARLDRAMVLLHEAQQQTKCETYSAEMLRRRQAMLSYESLIDTLESYSCLGSASSFVSLHIRPISQAIGARAWVLSEANDPAGFEQLLKDTNGFLTATSEIEDGLLIDELMLIVHASAIAENLSPAAAKLGLHDEAARWQEITDRLTERKEQRNNRIFTVDGKQADLRAVAGGICGSSLEMVSKQAESGVPSWSLLLALGLLAIPVIWLAQASLRAVFSRGDRLSDRATNARLLIPAYALAMLVAISTVPFFRMSEQTWFARESLIKPDPQLPSWSRYEYQIAVQVRKELREILDMVP
jgi:hypothetical protein